MAAIFRLEWQRDARGYDVVERGPSPGRTVLTDVSAATLIVPRGGKPETYVVEGIENRIFEQLANAPRTPEGALSFVNKWGLLHREPSNEAANDLNEIYDAMRDLRTALDLADPSDFTRLERY